MSYLVSEIMTEVRSRIGETSEGFWKDVEFYRWIDQAQKRIQSDFPHIEDTTTDTSVKDQQAYDLPTGYLQEGMRAVYYDGDKLKSKEFDIITEEHDDVFTAKGTVEDYFIYNKKVYLRKIPEEDGKEIKYFFWKVPDKITKSDQTLEVDDQYYEVVVKYVVQQALYKHEDYEAGALHRDEADMQREDIKSNKQTKIKDRVPTIQPAELDNELYRIGG